MDTGKAANLVIHLDDAIMKHWWKFDSFTFQIYEWESGF